MEDTTEINRDSVVKLNKDNFLEFREVVMDKALKYGDPGIWLNNGAYPVDMREPSYEMLELIQDPNNPGQWVEGQARKYPNNAAGQQKFNADYVKFHRNRDKCLQLISWLITNVEKDIRAKLETTQGFRQACANSDVLRVWDAIQNTVMGQGTISVFSVVAKYMKMKQNGPNDFARFVKDFNALRMEYRRFMGGNPAQILEVVDTCLFIKGCDQNFFKEKLQAIYGANNWGQVDQIIQDFTTYAINRERMNDLIKDSKEGAVPAYKADRMRIPRGNSCWNCGKIGHRKEDCTQDPHVCNNCGRNHLERFCHQNPTGGGKQDAGGIRKETEKGGAERRGGQNKGGGGPQARGGQRKPSRKAEKRKRVLQQSAAYLLKLATGGFSDSDEAAENEEEEPDEQDEEYDGENAESAFLVHINGTDVEDGRPKKLETGSDTVADDGNITGGERSKRVEVAECFMVHESYMPANNNDSEDQIEALKAAIKNMGDQYFILDTGCKRMNICKDVQMLESAVDTNISVTGITGDSCSGNKMGYLPIAHKTIWAPNADANLISVRQLVEDYGGSFVGDADKLVVLDKDGSEVITGRTKFGGFWACSYDDLVKARERRMRKHQAYPVQLSQSMAVVKHYTPEERSRALEAWRLCQLLGHPGVETIKRDLNNNCYLDTRLTARDVANGEELYGPCLGCLEGKLHGPDETPSTSPPANSVGEHLHADLVSLSTTSLGGGTVMLVSVDEKSGYVSLLVMKDKTTKSVCLAFEHVISFFRSHGHTPRRITTDSESTLIKAKVFLGVLGVALTTTPAGMHEKRVERYIQVLKARKRSMVASLPYKLPLKLEGEAYHAAAQAMNRSSNSVSRPNTPEFIVTGQRPFIPEHKFGQPGIVHSRRLDERDLRAEYCIFLSYGDVKGSIRVYIPTRDQVYSRRVFKPLDHVPQEWGLVPRLQVGNTPVSPTPAEMLVGHPEMTPVSQPVGMTPTSLVDRLILEEEVLAEPLQHQEGEPPVASAPAVVPVPMSHSDPYVPIAGEQSKVRVGEDVATVQNNDMSDPNSTPKPPDTVADSPTPQSPQQESTRPWRKAKANKGWKDGRYYAACQKARSCPVAYRISLRAALNDKKLQGDAFKSIVAEIKNIGENNVVQPVKKEEIPVNFRRGIIPTHIFLKMKYKADGSFDKLKARLVANGDRQPFDSIGETFSPTVNQISVNTQLNLTVLSQAFLSSYDIKGAFLKTKMREGKKIFIRLGKQESILWISVYPEHSEYIDEDGYLHFSLLSYMYGLCEAPNQFHELLDRTLHDMGFLPTRADSCMYTRMCRSGLMVLSAHVDDLLLTSPTIKERGWFEKELQKHFEIVIQHDNISYIGMNITYNRDLKILRCTQEGFVKDLIDRYDVAKHKKKPATPCTEDIFKNEEGSKPVTNREYLALIMSLMFVARFTRPDVLLPVTVLATFSSSPTERHMAQAIRILKYLAIDPKKGLHFDGNSAIDPAIYADASHAIHPSGHGQGGLLLTLGSAPIFCRSFKLKSVTRSSSESELYALEEASTYAVWWKCLLEELRAMDKGTPMKVFQDNMSTIFMATDGGTFKRTKHLITREMFVRERIKNNEIKLLHSPTDEMRADFLTKAMTRPKLESHTVAIRLVGEEN